MKTTVSQGTVSITRTSEGGRPEIALSGYGVFTPPSVQAAKDLHACLDELYGIR